MPVKSRVPYARDATRCGRVPEKSNSPRRVVVPPTSPASTIFVDNRFILLHLDAVPPARKYLSGGRLPAGSSQSHKLQPLAGQVVVFTGKLSSLGRKDASALVTQLGGATAEDINAKTTMLVVGAEGFGSVERSQKLKRAEE